MTKKRTAMLALLVIFGIFCAVNTGFSEATLAARPYGAPVDGTIRVLLSSLGQRQALGLTLAGAYSVGSDRGFQFEPDTEIRLGLENGNIVLEVGGAAIDMGGGFTLVRHLDAQGNAGGAYIHESEKDTLYCGDLSFGVSGGSLRVIVALDIEEYLYGVVPYEMSDTFPLEALKAQAVAARTYAMQRKTRNQDLDYDVVDTTNDQVFKGLDARFLRPIQAVDETRGIVGMLPDGSYAECFYSASNGGQTALASDVWGKGNFAYLDMRDDPYDLENPESVVKKATIPKDATKMAEPLYGLLVEQVGQKLIASGQLRQGEAVGLSRVEKVEALLPLYGGESRQYGTIRFTVKASVRRLLPASTSQPQQLGEAETLETPLAVDLSFYGQVRSALNIAINTSSYELVEVSETDEGFVLTTRRYGHGVGLSQRGAQWMAGTYNMNHLEILNFYYPGLALVQMTWIEKPLTKAAALPESLGFAAARPTPAPTPGPLPALSEGEYYAAVRVEGVDSTLNVREEPSLAGRLIGQLRNGARMIVMAETEDGWARMKTAEIEGYVSMQFIVKETEGQAATFEY